MQRTDTILFNHETARPERSAAVVPRQMSSEQFAIPTIPRPFAHTPEQRDRKLVAAARVYPTPDAIKREQIKSIVRDANAHYEQNQRKQEQIMPPEQVAQWMQWVKSAGVSLDTMRVESSEKGNRSDYGLTR